MTTDDKGGGSGGERAIARLIATGEGLKLQLVIIEPVVGDRSGTGWG